MQRRSLLLGVIPLYGWTLPRVLIVGDSISIGYSPFVQSRLSKMAHVRRINGNGGDSANVHAHLVEWLGSERFDLVNINCGLHDLKHTVRHQVAPEQYQQNLESIFAEIEARGMRCLWVTTTPIHDQRHAERKAGFSRLNRDVMRYNEIALKVARSRQIPVCDLYEIVQRQGPDRMLSKDGTHYEPAGYQILAEAVSDAVSRELKRIR